MTIQAVRAKPPGNLNRSNMKCYLAGFTEPVTYTNERGEVKTLSNIVVFLTTLESSKGQGHFGIYYRGDVKYVDQYKYIFRIYVI